MMGMNQDDQEQRPLLRKSNSGRGTSGHSASLLFFLFFSAVYVTVSDLHHLNIIFAEQKQYPPFQGTPHQQTSALAPRNQPFPRWEDEGIDIQSILEYFNYSTRPSTIDAKYDLLDPSGYELHKRKTFTMASVAYVWGASKDSFESSIRTLTSNNLDLDLWVENRRRSKLPMFIVLDRYVPIEKLLRKSIDHLLQTKDSSRRWKRVRNLLSHSNYTAGIPMILKLDDNRLCSKNNLRDWKNQSWTVPVWRLAVHYNTQDCNYELPLPTYSFLSFIQEHQSNATGYIQENHQKYPWSAKKRSIIWRGGMTMLSRPYLKHRRNRMIIQASRNGTNASDSILDVRIVNQNKHKAVDLMKKHGVRIGEKIPFEDFQQHVGILDVDGNSWSERFGRLLCMSSIVMKVEPEFVDFFMPQVQPWVHYVPVNGNSTDLWSKSQWVLDPANEEKVQQIIQNANQWCETAMSYQKSMEYVLDAMEKYVTLLDNNNPRWSEEWSQALRGYPYSNHEWSVPT